MSNTYIIDGIGDEVTITFGILLAVVVVVVAWLSTRVNDYSSASVRNVRTTRVTRPTLSRASRSENRSTAERHRSPAAQRSDTSEDRVISEDVTPSSAISETPSSALSEAFGLRQRSVPGQQAEQPSQPVQSPSNSSDPSIPLTISIRLKFMDETLQTVRASPDETLESFRRRSLPAETWNRYRLIYRGQVLSDGSQTLTQLNLTGDTSGDGSSIPVIHCFLASAAATQGPNLSASRQMQLVAEELQIGSLLLPVLGMCLFCLWYLCIFHTSLFSIQSVVSILGFTFLYIALIVNHFL